jgi:peptide/nickel transport system permease protein
MIFSKKIYNPGSSLSRLAWSKFRKSITGMISLLVIVTTIVIAILGYLITPDSTPMCNTQILEVSTQKPGFQADFLLVRKNQPLVNTSLLKKMFSGAQDNYHYIPVSNIEFINGEVIATLFNPESNILIKDEFSMADVVYPVEESTEVDENSIKIIKVDGSEVVESYDKLKNEILNNNIEKRTYLLGTDQFGRDLLSRLIIGSRVSISVGAISVAISLLVGVLLGASAGFYRGKTDDIIMWFINVVWSIPTLLLVIAITFALGRGFWQIFIAVGLTMWVEVARVVRGQVLSMREKEYVEAGFALGFSNLRIITRHIIPNILSPVIVISAANFAAAILIEAGLSFLGIGVQPPMPSWGSMIKEYYSFIILDSAYLAITPGIAIIILVLAFMTLGNALRDTLDVKMQK